jgi:hypothetical protein
MASGCAAVLVAALSFASTTSGAPNLDGQSTFVPIEPCRLLDTRPAPTTVGPRATPLGPGETYRQQVTGPNGDCNVPSGATAVTMNTTALSATDWSFATIHPAGTPLPNASSLNYVPGQAPIPNSVTVTLSPGGAIDIYNAFGSVDLLADVTGYYTDDTLEQIGLALDGKADLEAVYTRAEVDALLAGLGGAPEPIDAYTEAEVDALLSAKAEAADVYTKHEVDEHFATERIWTANVNAAGAKTSPGVYLSQRMGVGWYRLSFDVEGLGYTSAADRVITATSNCMASVGNTFDNGSAVGAELALITVDIQVQDAIGNPLDCPIDVMMKIVE